MKRSTSDESTIEQISPLDLPPEQEAILAAEEQVPVSNLFNRDGLGTPIEQRVAIASVRQDTRELTVAGRTYLVHDPIPSMLKEERKRTLREINQTTTQMLQEQSAQRSSADPPIDVVLNEFIDSHEKEETRFYKVYLPKSVPILGLRPTPRAIIEFRNSLKCSPGGKNAYLRALKAFYKWLYSPESGYDFRPSENPSIGLKPLKVPKRNMPAQTEETFNKLMAFVSTFKDPMMNLRSRALLCTFINSGGRLREIAGIQEPDILWNEHKIRVIGKGDCEKWMPMGPTTENLLREWISKYSPSAGENIWGLTMSGVVSFFRRLEKGSGIKANPHSYRRGFASILEKMGLSDRIIQKLGGWESQAMVNLYTKSNQFSDVQQHYVEPTVASFQSAALPTELPRHADCGTSTVRESIIRILTHLTAAGQAASQLLSSLQGDHTELAKFGTMTGQFSALLEILDHNGEPEKAREIEYLKHQANKQ